jgi:hypothetical protein
LRLENWASTRCNLSFADQPFAADAKKYPKKGMGQANQITVADFGKRPSISRALPPV